MLGVQRGDFHIAPDMLANIFRSSTIGATPHHNIFLDGLYAVIGWVRKHFVVLQVVRLNIALSRHFIGHAHTIVYRLVCLFGVEVSTAPFCNIEKSMTSIWRLKGSIKKLFDGQIAPYI